MDRIEQNLQRQLEWIKTADSKVAPLYTINVAMLGLLATLIKVTSDWGCIKYSLTAATIIVLSVSLICLTKTLFPKLNGPSNSLVFFGEISKLNIKDFSERISAQTDDEYSFDVINQIHRNAQIASEKYATVKYAFISTLVATPLWLITVFSLYIK
jgi:hypothetical protein